MKEWIDLLMVVIVIFNFMLISFTTLQNCIRLVAFQGIVTAIIPFLFPEHGFLLKTILVSAATVTIKGIFFPWLLFRALKKVSIRKEVEPFIGSKLSMLIGLGALILAFSLSAHLFIPTEISSFLVVSVSLFTIFIGLFIIISRTKAITQVLGYLVIENGIALFSFAFLIEQPMLVELGILLDVFVGVFVMGITIFYIHREFDHINTHKLSQLKD